MNEFSKTSICIILVVLVYLESAKICTGPKIVRGLKKLRTTVLDIKHMIAFTSDIASAKYGKTCSIIQTL